MSIYNYFSNGNPVQGAIFGILFAISIIVILYGWGRKRKLSQQWLSGRYYVLQILGALLKSHTSCICWLLVYLGFFGLTPKLIIRIHEGIYSPPANALIKILIIAICFISFGITAYIIANLNKLYSLRRQETRITVSQLALSSSLSLEQFLVGYSKIQLRVLSPFSIFEPIIC